MINQSNNLHHFHFPKLNEFQEFYHEIPRILLVSNHLSFLSLFFLFFGLLLNFQIDLINFEGFMIFDWLFCMLATQIII